MSHWRTGILGPSTLLSVLLVLVATSAPSAFAQAFERDIAPFPVYDTLGAPLAGPFVGGFARPRPHLVDLDDDGDLDLAVQEAAGRVLRFENTGGRANAFFAWRSDRFLDGRVGEWVRFADADRDGRADLFAETPLGYVRFFAAGAAASTEGRFVLVEDTLRLTTGAPLFVDRQNVPALGDLDGDGRIDLLYAQVDGALTFFEGAAPAPSGAPRFRPAVEGYQGIQIIGEFASQSFSGFGKTSDSKHGASALSLADVDGDGDLDLLWGDFFSPSLYLVRNAGTATNPRLVREADVWPPPAPLRTTGFNATAFGDLDGDGDADLLVGIVGGAFGASGDPEPPLVRYAQTAPGRFTRFTDPPVSMLDVGTASAPAAGDFDGDGDLDLVIGVESGPLRAFENTSSALRPVLRPRPPLALDARTALAPTAADLDSDGRADLVVGGFDGSVRWYRRTGAFAFAPADTALARPPRAQLAAPALADVDGDGDLDLVVGEASGDLNFYRNAGTRAAPRFVLETEALVPRAGRNAHPALADVDGDGDADLLVGTAEGALDFYLNVGTATSPRFERADAPSLEAQPLAAPAFADADGDADPDVLVGTEGGGLLFFRTTARVAAPAPGVLTLRTPAPHPARGLVRLRFHLGAAAPVGACVSDVFGRKVACLAETAFAVGEAALGLRVDGWAPGVYVYRFTVGGRAGASGTLVVVR